MSAHRRGERRIERRKKEKNKEGEGDRERVQGWRERGQRECI